MEKKISTISTFLLGYKYKLVIDNNLEITKYTKKVKTTSEFVFIRDTL